RGDDVEKDRLVLLHVEGDATQHVVRPEVLLHALELEEGHRSAPRPRPGLARPQPVGEAGQGGGGKHEAAPPGQSGRRAKGMVISTNATPAARLGDRLNSWLDVRRARLRTSSRPITLRSAVSFCRLMKSLSNGGMIRRTACGVMT